MALDQQMIGQRGTLRQAMPLKLWQTGSNLAGIHSQLNRLHAR